MDFAIKSLLPQSSGNGKSTNVVDQDPAQLTEEFAKLLVAQIQNQDPEAPVDPTEIMSQNAQFTAALANVRLANQMAHYEQVATSLRVMGKPAEYIDPNDFTGTPQVGIVTGADYSVSPPGLIINGSVIPLDNITRIDGDQGSAVDGQQLQEVTKLKQIQMLGKTVEYFDPNTNANATGVIDEIDLLSQNGLVTINGTSVPLADVIRIIN